MSPVGSSGRNEVEVEVVVEVEVEVKVKRSSGGSSGGFAAR